MSLDSIIGAAGSVLQSVSALEHEVGSTALEAVQSGVDAISDVAGPVAFDALQQVAANPQWFGDDLSGLARLLADTYGGNGPLPYSTATQL